MKCTSLVMVVAISASFVLVACDDSAPGAVCGDGVLDTSAGEACDDGNLTDGDGCDGACRREGGWYCIPGSSCVAVCGDQLVVGPEVCDDGNFDSRDGCSADCMSDETCGNLYVDFTAGEECDDGNNDNGDDCRSDCRQDLTLCGNGSVDPGETCDDGNLVDGDGCEAHCLATPILLVGAPFCAEDFEIDATHAYFTNVCTDEIMKVDKAGGTPVTLASGQAYAAHIALDSTNVYWVTQSVVEVVKVPKAGGSPVSLGGSMSLEVVRDIAVGATHVYLADGNSLAQLPIDGGTLDRFPNPGGAKGVTVDAMYVYFVADYYDMGPWEKGVFRVPVGGGSVQKLNITSEYGVMSTCAVDVTHVYFTDRSQGPRLQWSDSHVRRLPKGGGAHTNLAIELMANINGMTVDDTNVYWTTNDGAVRKVAKAGGPPITLASCEANPARIAVDETHVYRVNRDTSELLKVPK